MTTTTTNITLTRPVRFLEATADDGKPRTPRFTIDAYDGGLMDIDGFDRPVIIRLAGLEVKSQQIPILRDHQNSQVVGHTESIEIGEQNVKASGRISGTGDAAKEVVASADNDFPWEASVGVKIKTSSNLRRGETKTINGREIAGPAIVVESGTLREISFTAIGASESTAAQIYAQQKKDNSMDDTQTTQEPIDGIEQKLDTLIDMMSKLVDGDDTAEEPQADTATASAKLASLRATRRTAPKPSKRSATAADSGQVIHAALSKHIFGDSIAEKHFDAGTMQRAHDLRCSSIADVAKVALQAAGLADIPHTAEAIIGAAFGDRRYVKAAGPGFTDLGEILVDSTQKETVRLIEQAESSRKHFCANLDTKKLQNMTPVRLKVDEPLSTLGAGGEIDTGTTEHTSYDVPIETKATTIRVARKDLVNDDLGVLQDMPRYFQKLAEAAISGAVWSDSTNGILANPSNHWSAGNANYFTTALSIYSLGTGISKMRRQDDDAGTPARIEPRVLVVPPELESTAKAIVASMEIQAAEGSPSGNPWKAVVDVAVEPLIASSTAWFLFAGPQDAPWFCSFLNGSQVPTIKYYSPDAESNFLTAAWKCYLDVGAAKGDFRASVYSLGDGS